MAASRAVCSMIRIAPAESYEAKAGKKTSRKSVGVVKAPETTPPAAASVMASSGLEPIPETTVDEIEKPIDVVERQVSDGFAPADPEPTADADSRVQPDGTHRVAESGGPAEEIIVVNE